MAQTLSNIKLHLVFSTKKRFKYIQEGVIQKRLYRYISKVCHEQGTVLEEIGGMEDHIHIMVKLSPRVSVSELVRAIKSNTSKMMKTVDAWCGDFAWQGGYGAFSVDKSIEDKVRKYICGQKEHHKQQTFKDEYLWLLQRDGIEYDERFLWDDG